MAGEYSGIDNSLLAIAIFANMLAIYAYSRHSRLINKLIIVFLFNSRYLPIVVAITQKIWCG